MRTRHGWYATAVVVTALATGVAGCGGDDGDDGGGSSGGGKQSVGVIIKGLDNPFFQSMDKGVKAAGREQGATVKVQAAAGLDDNSGQASKLEALIGQKLDCYVVNPISQTNLVQPLARLGGDAPVVNIDSPVGGKGAEAADLDIATYIGTDNVDAGKQGADTMASSSAKGGKVAIIGGVSGDATSAARIKGFTQAAGGRFDTLKPVAADWERQKAQTAAEDLLRANPDLKGFFAANDDMALGIAQALDTTGKKGKVAVVGVDGIEDALKAVERGSMTATVSQYPYTIGQLGVEACIAAARGEKLPKKVDAPVQVVTKANAAKAQKAFPEPVEPFEDPFAALLQK